MKNALTQQEDTELHNLIIRVVKGTFLRETDMIETVYRKKLLRLSNPLRSPMDYIIGEEVMGPEFRISLHHRYMKTRSLLTFLAYYRFQNDIFYTRRPDKHSPFVFPI